MVIKQLSSIQDTKMFEFNQRLASSLTITDKVYNTSGELYTGVIFFEKEKGFLDGQYVKEGILTQERYIPLCVASWMPEGHEFSFINGAVAEEEESQCFSLLQYIDTEEIIRGINLVLVCFDEDGVAYQQTYYDKAEKMPQYEVVWDETGIDAYLAFHDFIVYSKEDSSFWYKIYTSPSTFYLNDLMNNELYKSKFGFSLIGGKISSIALDEKIFEQDLITIRNKLPFLPYKNLEEIFSTSFAEKLKLQNDYDGREYNTSILDQFYEYRAVNNIDNVKEIVQTEPNNLHSFLNFPQLETLKILCYGIKSYADNGILEKMKEYLKEYKNRYGRSLYKMALSYDDKKIEIYPRREDV